MKLPWHKPQSMDPESRPAALAPELVDVKPSDPTKIPADKGDKGKP